MRFITEGDLRDIYKTENFSSYTVEPGTKLTPGAREFLADRKIPMLGDHKIRKNAPIRIKKNSGTMPEIIGSRLKSLEALSFSFAEELLNDDISSAQKMIELAEIISTSENQITDSNTPDVHHAKACTGIGEDTIDTDLEDCFRINAFHIQLKKGKGIIRFHRLRCALRELKAEIHTMYDSTEKDPFYENLSKQINVMINTLSQHICDAVGGEECQIKK